MTTERENARDLGDRDRISSDTWEKVTETLHQENKSAMQDSVEISSRKNDIPVDQQQQVSGGGSVNYPKEKDGERVPESSPPVVVIAPNDSNASNREPRTDDAGAAPVGVRPQKKKQGPKNAAKATELAADEMTEDAAEKQQEGPKKKAARVENAAKKENDAVQGNIPQDESSIKAKVPVEENEYALASDKLNISPSQEEVMSTITAANQSGHVANRPLGLPIYAWGVIGVGLVLGVVLGALAARKRRRRKSASIGPTSTSTKKRIAIDYGDDDSVDVEELSIESDISSLSGQWSGGTFVVRQDRV